MAFGGLLLGPAPRTTCRRPPDVVERVGAVRPLPVGGTAAEITPPAWRWGAPRVHAA